MSDELNPNLSQRELSGDAQANRALYEIQIADQIALEPAMEAHQAAYRLALDDLDCYVTQIADSTDLDLVSDTRPAAVWQMAGRSVGLSRACLDLMRLGYCAEVIPLARTLHEANRLVQTFAQRNEDELLRIWLADEGRHKWVRPKQAREAIERAEDKLNDLMRRHGADAPGTTTELSIEIYDQFSRAAHNRRAWVQDAVSADLRQMATGPHRSPVRRAGTLAAIGGTLEEAVQLVGDALAATFYGTTFWTTNVQPHVKSFEALRATHPLI
jgi:hypothetical protein